MWTWTGSSRFIVFHPVVDGERLPRLYEDDSVDPALHPPPEVLDDIHAILPNGAVVWPQRDGLTLSFDYDLPDRTRVVAGDSTLYVVKGDED